jgi:predicted nucleic acid-binding protein
MVLVDTPVWSLALRRKASDLGALDRSLVQALHQLIREGRVQLLGSTRQEVLSGIREESQFRRIRDDLRGFSNVKLEAEDYEEAAHISNRCRRAGVAGNPVDMLVCAVSILRDWPVFTTDRDFVHYRRVIPLRVFSISS